ncbi:unnamed protein product [Discosporangium mesarthrocarpum]
MVKQRFFSVAKPHASELMRCVRYSAIGSPEVLEFTPEIPRPCPVKGQVLIRITASSVNPVDCKFRAHPVARPFRPVPKIPGGDVSGTVVEAPAGSAFEVGNTVFALAPLLGQMWGTCAEYIAIDEKLVAPSPASIQDLAEASALPLVSLTIVQAMDPVVRSLGDTQGKQVLIHAGAGGLGTFAIQYCKNVLGMCVACTCSSRNGALVRGLGADVVIDYTVQDFEEVCQDYDVVIDPLPYIYRGRSLRVLKRQGGHYVHIASSPWRPGASDCDPLGLAIPEARADRMLGGAVRTLWGNISSALGRGPLLHGPVFVHPSGEELRHVSGWVDAGLIRPVVDRRYPLEKAAEAHAYVEEGHARGKVLVTV